MFAPGVAERRTRLPRAYALRRLRRAAWRCAVRPLRAPGTPRRRRSQPGGSSTCRRSLRNTRCMVEQVIPMLRASDAAASLQWCEWLEFEKESGHRFADDLPAFVAVLVGDAPELALVPGGAVRCLLWLGEPRGAAVPHLHDVTGELAAAPDLRDHDVGPLGGDPHGCIQLLRVISPDSLDVVDDPRAARDGATVGHELDVLVQQAGALGRIAISERRVAPQDDMVRGGSHQSSTPSPARSGMACATHRWGRGDLHRRAGCGTWIGHGIIPWPGRPDTVAHPSAVRDRIRLLRDRRRREELQQVPGELARAFLADVVPAAVDD
jgi:hypothetical protein